MELWLDIKGFEGHYQVSNLGRVRSLDRGMYVRQDRYSKPRWTNRKGRILKPGKDGKGYLMVRLCLFGIPKQIMVHRLVALHFIDNPDSKPVVNHIDANPFNNRAANLEWCTIKENNHHTIKLGRRPNNGRTAAKLTDIQVKTIKTLLLSGEHPVTIAQKFNISRTTIIGIRDGRTWINI